MEADENIIKNQSNWHSKGLQGCLYASYIFRKLPEESGLARLCINTPITEQLFITIINLINEKISDPDTCILSIIIPQITTAEGLLSFIDGCKKYTNWIIDDKEVVEDIKLVKIRINIYSQAESDKKVFSWMLGFAPLPFFPKTRQSPFFEIMIATKSKEFMQDRYKRITPTRQSHDTKERGGTIMDAHLADVYIKHITDNPKADHYFWTNSEKMKALLLPDSITDSSIIHNAKAKITFSYPMYYEEG